MRVAAIDVGTNSIRLLVAEVQSGGEELTTLARAGEPCRLGRGLDQSGRISEEMAERAAQVAGDFARRARSFGVRHIVLGATAALRSAANGAEVAELISARCGVRPRILTGDDEARLVYRAVVAGLGARARRSPCIVFDLGGGSTEVISGVGLEAGRWVSLPFGAVTLTERHFRNDPPQQAEIDALRATVQNQLMQSCASLPPSTPLLAGVGGTVTLLGMLDRGLAAYEPTALEGWMIPTERVRERVASLQRLRHDERMALPAMGEGRADIVIAGALVVELLTQRFPSAGLVCSTQGLRYALARLAAEEATSGGPAEEPARTPPSAGIPPASAEPAAAKNAPAGSGTAAEPESTPG